jgi:arsenical pump membrane protein
MQTSVIIIWVISVLAIALVITRPFKVPEYVWASSGAGLLLVLRLLTPAEGLAGVAKGIDVYLFLTGMMLLAETAREEKLGRGGRYHISFQ